jgi:hypothetical protein
MSRHYVRSDNPVKPKKTSAKQGVNLKTEFEAFAAKRPVNHESSQVRAHQAFERVKHLFTEDELTKLSIAWGHATGCTNEGRQEHDKVCAEIRKRIWGV